MHADTAGLSGHDADAERSPHGASHRGRNNPQFRRRSSGASAISVDLASELRLHRKDLLYGHNMITQIGGLPAFEAADVPDVQVGVVHSDSMEMYIIGDTIRGRPLPMPGGEGVSGVLGTSFLKNFDVEFDFKSSKLN